jgi:magnesium chelatase subunit ChlI-like protein
MPRLLHPLGAIQIEPIRPAAGEVLGVVGGIGGRLVGHACRLADRRERRNRQIPGFNHKSLEVLRQPFEEGYVTISRSLRSTKSPAEFILVAAMNLCPCGYRTRVRIRRI